MISPHDEQMLRSLQPRSELCGGYFHCQQFIVLFYSGETAREKKNVPTTRIRSIHYELLDRDELDEDIGRSKQFQGGKG